MVPIVYRYCDAQGLSIPRAQCDPGYVCYGGAYTGTPNDGVTGQPCPEGTFCVTGSFEFDSCSPGTYSKSTGGTSDQDCQLCDPGYYCSKKQLTAPEGPCYPGYYCPEASIAPNLTATPAGHFTRLGSSEPQPCLPGTYQPHDRQSSCLPCRPGFYCPTKNMTSDFECERGFYCPPGSDRRFACPAGTFNNHTGQVYNSSCLGCPPGKYCNPTAQAGPTGTLSLSFKTLFFQFLFTVRLVRPCSSLFLGCLIIIIIDVYHPFFIF